MSHLIVLDLVFKRILQTSCEAAVLAALILLAQYLLGRRLSPFWRHGLWFLLLARLLMPSLPQTVFSIFNLTPIVARSPVINSLSAPPPPGTQEPRQFLSQDNQTTAADRKLPPVTAAVVTTDWFGFAAWLIIITLCVDAEEGVVKNLCSDDGRWLQGYIDPKSMDDAYGLNGPQTPPVLLIDPEGTISAIILPRNIHSTVAVALAKK